MPLPFPYLVRRREPKKMCSPKDGQRKKIDVQKGKKGAKTNSGRGGESSKGYNLKFFLFRKLNIFSNFWKIINKVKFSQFKMEFQGTIIMDMFYFAFLDQT